MTRAFLLFMPLLVLHMTLPCVGTYLILSPVTHLRNELVT